ncbi:maltose acetyltransferase domain-containing protein [Micromonospora sp. M12]
MKDRMLAGEPYLADDPEIIADQDRAARLMERFNTSAAADPQARIAVLRDLLGEVGDSTWIRPPFYCDYGWQIRIGPRSFVSYNAVFLDVAPITIGADVQIGPNVQLLTLRTRWNPFRAATSGRRRRRSPSVTMSGSAVVPSCWPA